MALSAHLPRLPALLLAGGILAGCSGAPRLEIGEPEARLSGSLAGVCAVFVRIANSGDRGDALVGASADLPGAVAEIHEVRGGRMVRSDRLPIPAGGSLELRAGGPHIMVFQLPPGAGAGRELGLRLLFERSGERRVSVRIGG